MTTFPSFCRITGHARNLPKPCYFPLLPPLSPADAKKLCRITGKATDSHHYSPIISFGKTYNFDGLEGCKITQFENFEFTRPTFIKYKENEKTIEHFTDLLARMKTKRKKKVDVKRLFVYKINDQTSRIVFSPELEEAIRTGEIEAVSVSKDMSHMSVKIKQGRIVKAKIEPIPKKEINADDNYFYGEGQSKETLEAQQQIINERNQRKQETMAMRNIFEQKDKKAEEAERLATERPKSKKPLIKFDALKRKEKLRKMGEMIEEQKNNKGIILPKFDSVSKVNPDEQIRYEKMLEDIANAQKKSINVTTVFSCNFDWSDMEFSQNAGFDWDSYPREDVCEPFEITIIDIQTNDMYNVPNASSLDIAAAVETVEPAPEIEQEILNVIRNIKDDNLKATEDVAKRLKDFNSEKMLPNVKDIGTVISEAKNYTHGYLVEDKDGKGTKFVKKDEFTPGTETGISGAMVTINNEQKFISGQFINLAKEETFIAGQTIQTPQGKRFVPGQTVLNNNGEISFIPGQGVTVDGEQRFVTGQVIDGKEGPKFMPGQMVDRGDQKPVFMSGQTVMTVDGPKFVPGEITIDEDGYQEFVPGMKMLTSDGERFIPGQAFQSEEGLSFTPGQTIYTEEGPSFIPGKSFKTTEGNRKFVKGDIVKTENGKLTFEISTDKLEIPLIKEDLVESNEEPVIPNDHLQFLAIAERDITGFLVKPTNTSNIQAGERLYGDLVETETVLFYLNGKLPKELPNDAKIISGELVVGETCQKFVPGRIMNTMGGEKFIPGQLVKTSHGEEFVPGQIVETADGPKFVPGQLVMTSEGEKFIPGQVVMEEEGPRFVPGQIIQTENGATFIPGQMMSTEKGQKFVPGQLVETKDGLRFVPGQVVETNEGPKFISGTVVETEDGLKYLPSSSNAGMEESEEESEISFQGFDISPEEMQLLSQNVSNARPRTPIGKEEGLIDSSTLKKLAAATMDIHGRTPEPVDKKKKKKKGKITIDALEEDEDTTYAEIEDNGTNKVEVLKHLVKIGKSFSSLRKEKELKILSELLDIEEDSNENEAELEAIKYINSISSEVDLFESYIGNDDQLITDILSCIGDIDDIVRNDQVRNVVNNAIKECITKKCDEQINALIDKISRNPDSLFTDSKAQILLTEAVGVVCVTGDVEVASMLEKFISKPTNPDCLRDDKDVLAVLRQLLVLQRIAERNPGVAKVLQELQDDPEGVKDRNKVRKLIREAKGLLVTEKKKEKAFDVRHVTSSKDIPNEIFEQIRKDKTEADKFLEELPDELFKAIMGDERCGCKLIKSLDADPMYSGKSKREIDKFKKGMAVVVAKDNMQAVIPKHYARSIYYGIMPYILIDEEGMKFFERGLTGRKLAPSRVIENTWFQPDSYYEKSVLYPQRVTPSGMQYNLVFLGDPYKKSTVAPSLQYTSLLPSSNPDTISYNDYQPRGSRDGSVTPLRTSRSTTPSRRSSITSLHDHFPAGGDSYSRRSSLSTGQYSTPATVSSIDTFASPIRKSSYSTPYSQDDDDDDEPSSIARSDTVGKLLDKYSNFSLSKEFGSGSRPQKSYTRHNTVNSYSNDIKDRAHSVEHKAYTPSYSTSRASSMMPEKSREYTPRSSQDRFKDLSLEDVPVRSTRRTHQRPFSDIFETDELDSPGVQTGSRIRSSLIDIAKKNYDAANSVNETSPAVTNDSVSYTNSLRNWKDKEINVESDEDDDDKYTPTRLSHNRYESVLTGEDDYSPSNSVTPTRSAYKTKTLNNADDDDDFSMTKFRDSLRKKYSSDRDNLSKTLQSAYTIPAAPTRVAKAANTDMNSEDSANILPRKTRQYGGCRSNSVGPDKYRISKTDGEMGFKNKEPPTDIHNGNYDGISGREGSYDYGGGYTPSSYGQPPLYNQPMGYGHNTGYRQPYGSGYGASPMYGNQYDPSRSYGAPMYGGTGGMNTYSPSSPYMPAHSPMRYGTGGYNMPMNRAGSTPGGYSGYGGPAYGGGYHGRGVYGGDSLPYGGLPRRYEPRLNLSKYLDDDDDDDVDDTYTPNKDRQLASKIAKKYLADSDDGDE